MSTYGPWLGTFEQVTGCDESAFALIARGGRQSCAIELLALDEEWATSLSDISLSQDQASLVVLPYCAIRDRGFSVQDDGAPIRVCRVRKSLKVPRHELIAQLPEPKHFLREAAFDLTDTAYAKVVSAIVAEEIGAGLGSNFVLKRTLCGNIEGYQTADALGYFRRLLIAETGAYWTFVIKLKELVLVGASPERHVSCVDGCLAMTPISGTLRLQGAAATTQELLGFVNDAKEAEELYMVLDEELKMMARLCPSGGVVTGPKLRYMSKVVHTEYEISGQTDADPLSVLRHTLVAPTVLGSPVESAARVVMRREVTPRGYYSGVAALIQPGSDTGVRDLDSAILIRTACIAPNGSATISVGSTIVRDSDPFAEAAETTAKAASLLSALAPDSIGEEANLISMALHRRGERVSKFWRTAVAERSGHLSALKGKRCLIINAEDDFTDMLAVIFRSLGMQVSVIAARLCTQVEGYDLVVFGPGPGSPTDMRDDRIQRIRLLLHQGLEAGVGFLAVCLSHQILGAELGMTIAPLARPHQGMQGEVALNGGVETVGFYNTYAVNSDLETIKTQWGRVEVLRHTGGTHVYALIGDRFASVQCHLESILSLNGSELLGQFAEGVISKSSSSVTAEGMAYGTGT